MASIELQPVRGTRDFYPEDMRLRSWLFGLWRDVAERFGFEEYDACVLEHEDLYIRKAGDEITGQLYNFSDKGDRRVALRPEMTPSLARMVMARQGSLPLPLRWFAVPQCFRYERMQRGRKREHFQWNMDIVGLDSVAAEVELMAAQHAFLEAAGVDLAAGEVVFKVSDRRVLQGFLDGLSITGETFAAACVVVDKVDKIGRDKTAEQLGELGIEAAAAEQILDLLAATGIEQLEVAVGADNPGVASLRQLTELAAAAGIGAAITIDPSVVRGLSYYTGTVWEIFAAAGNFRRAIAGGGRYDLLLETLGGKSAPMVGFGLGDVPIIEFLTELGRLPALPGRLDDVVYPMSESEFVIANRIATKLRGEGRRVAVDYSGRRFKHVIARAESDGAERLFILGAREVAEGICKLRSLGTVRDEVELRLDELLDG
ncbi:MAG: histidine--tRNA ligase [Planctomycetota bacterium]|jgi:histidyl-tRNA synthetase|nr:histidine--tRNA ligase [Planctomycetota bacterium]